MKLGKSAAWVGCTAAALLTASGCGTEVTRTAVGAAGDADTVMAALTRATDRTEDLGSAEVRMTTDLGNGSGPVTMDGTFSWGSGYAYDVEMDTAAANMQALQDSPKIHCLFVDGVYYYKMLKGKQWMKVDASAVLGEDGAQSLDGGAGSPTASMKGLQYADDVQDLGAQTVDGQRTTHYRAVVDKARMGDFEHAFNDKDSVLGSLTGGASSITMDVWVGAGDLPVRMTQEMGAVTVTMDFEKFGRTAAVEAPPAALTADVTDRLENASPTG